ncbi:type II toxin-antitoxin system VapC family toxin [Candidatus Gottesmanbacteria bacterium]|nr:type II toxin-antitoxin system VapC family toxin [Candidatus Gottesmanbacteria bacterium]
MVVIDTSVAFKWFATEKEELLSQSLGLLKEHLTNKEIIVAPDLIIYELANAWATKTKLSIDKINIFIKDFEETGIKIEPITYKLINKAINFSKKYHVSVYDGAYAVLAQEKNCNLYTADIDFVKDVKLNYVKYLGEYQK